MERWRGVSACDSAGTTGSRLTSSSRRVLALCWALVVVFLSAPELLLLLSLPPRAAALTVESRASSGAAYQGGVTGPIPRVRMPRHPILSRMLLSVRGGKRSPPAASSSKQRRASSAHSPPAAVGTAGIAALTAEESEARRSSWRDALVHWLRFPHRPFNGGGEDEGGEGGSSNSDQSRDDDDDEENEEEEDNDENGDGDMFGSFSYRDVARAVLRVQAADGKVARLSKAADEVKMRTKG